MGYFLVFLKILFKSIRFSYGWLICYSSVIRNWWKRDGIWLVCENCAQLEFFNNLKIFSLKILWISNMEKEKILIKFITGFHAFKYLFILVNVECYKIRGCKLIELFYFWICFWMYNILKSHPEVFTRNWQFMSRKLITIYYSINIFAYFKC